jgi:hypothetical protein
MLCRTFGFLSNTANAEWDTDYLRGSQDLLHQLNLRRHLRIAVDSISGNKRVFFPQHVATPVLSAL